MQSPALKRYLHPDDDRIIVTSDLAVFRDAVAEKTIRGVLYERDKKITAAVQSILSKQFSAAVIHQIKEDDILPLTIEANESGIVRLDVPPELDALGDEFFEMSSTFNEMRYLSESANTKALSVIKLNMAAGVPAPTFHCDHTDQMNSSWDCAKGMFWKTLSGKARHAAPHDWFYFKGDLEHRSSLGETNRKLIVVQEAQPN